MNIFKKIDRAIGRKFYKSLIRLDVKAYKRVGFTEPDAIAQIIQKNRKDMLKLYSITFDEIKTVVDDYCVIKQLNGIGLWIALRKAQSTLETSIGKKRLRFLGNGKVEYTDKDFHKFVVDYAGLEDIFVVKSQMGYPKGSIVKLLEKYSKKRRK
jgi:hypothetical protein